jgi:hypothetical protein
MRPGPARAHAKSTVATAVCVLPARLPEGRTVKVMHTSTLTLTLTLTHATACGYEVACAHFVDELSADAVVRV